jgi:pyruvate,water dikinase
MTDPYVLELHGLGPEHAGLVGGKGARLAELARIEGIRVPPAFCVTTSAFQRITAEAPALGEQLERLSRLPPSDREATSTVGAAIRQTLEAVAMRAELVAVITSALARLGEHAAYAVRSSATAEDLPSASFAGQHDTYLNVVGPAAILGDIRRCWASLFSERAVVYRQRNGIDHRTVFMAVVVQRMVVPQAAGILFTADPITGNRKLAAVDASYGLGEAVVSGLVNPDVFKVRDGNVVGKVIAAKKIAIHALPGGGTQQVAVDAQHQEQPALTDAQVVRLVQLGRRIEAHFGGPQDIEWCLVDDGFQIVQSRPITTLFPIPERGDQQPHVYLSVGHQQMMTDAMKPLGVSVWQLTALAPMHDAGGRLFVDVTARLASPASRAELLDLVGRGDPLFRDALSTIVERGDVIPVLPEAAPVEPLLRRASGSIATDPAIVTGLIERCQASLAALRREISTKTGPALFEFLLEAFQEHKRVLSEPRSRQATMAGIEATWWLNDQLHAWLGEKNAADMLTRSAPGNITSEMGLALLEVADVIRPHAELVAFLQAGTNDAFLEQLPQLPGGSAARATILSYLDRYGMRCVGEIDITRPRWSERPSTLVPMILDNIKLFPAGAAARRFEQGQREADQKRAEILQRLRALPDGDQKAEQANGMIDRVRTFIGYREYPKYYLVCRYFIYKQALLSEAERLVQAHVLPVKEDIFYLTFQELHDLARTEHWDEALVQRRKAAFRAYQALTPPRVLTSDGEAVVGQYRRHDAPAGALIGLPVSAGIVEGRARVILDIAQAELQAGDILVTAFTDPSWSPLFVAVSGLVTEVGGLMTHGAVIAREYGLPAVVGVAGATRLIAEGQRIRVHGSDGYVEIL